MIPSQRAFYHKDGRLRGAYVYMLLCHDEGGPIYVKVGISVVPTRRLAQLRTACAATPHIFATVEVTSRELALKIEDELKFAYRDRNTVGEWFKISIEEKAEFNKIWKEVFLRHSKPDWPLKWEQISVKGFEKAAAKNFAYARSLYKRRGAAWRAFCHDQY